MNAEESAVGVDSLVHAASLSLQAHEHLCHLVSAASLGGGDSDGPAKAAGDGEGS